MNNTIKRLSGYYALLQSGHILLLLWAGYVLLQTGKINFMAAPPTAGWSPQVIPFLIGMGVVDGLAASLAIVYAYQGLKKGNWIVALGLVSLAGAISSAIIYLVGTIFSGAWILNPTAYLSMVVLFSPAILLFLLLFINVIKK